MTATQVQWRAGTATEHASFVGAANEVTVDETNRRLVVHDGTTPGGNPQATKAYVDAALAGATAGAGSIYALYSSCT